MFLYRGFLVALGAALLCGCGQDVCISGIGKCNMHKNQPANPVSLQTGDAPTGLTTPVIGCKSWGQCWIRGGQNLQLMASGGKPPYTFHVVANNPGEIKNGNQLFVPTVGFVTKTRVRVTDTVVKITDVAPVMSEVEVTILPTNPTTSPRIE